MSSAATVMSSASPSPSPDAASAPVPAGLPCFLSSHREAKILWVFGTRVRFLVDGRDTDGRFSMQEHYVPAFHAGPPPHVHADFDELFYMLDGALKVTVGSTQCVAHGGDTLIVPRNTLHTFANPFLTPARFLVQLSPAGFERFFAELGVPPASATDTLTPPDVPLPSPAALRELAIKHGMRVPGLTD